MAKVSQAKGRIMLLFSAWLPVIAWMSVIFLLSSRTRVSVSPDYVLNFIFFKTLHVLEYAFLYLLSLRAVHMTRKKNFSFGFLGAYIIVVFFAVSDEVHQTFVPTREGAVRDVIIDAAGAALVWYILTQQFQKLPKVLKTLAKNLQLVS